MCDRAAIQNSDDERIKDNFSFITDVVFFTLFFYLCLIVGERNYDAINNKSIFFLKEIIEITIDNTS